MSDHPVTILLGSSISSSPVVELSNRDTLHSKRESERKRHTERERAREREKEKERKSQKERWRMRDQVREGAALDRSFGFGGETGRGGPGRYLDPKNSTLRISPPLALGLPSSSSEGRMLACQSLSLSLSLSLSIQVYILLTLFSDLCDYFCVYIFGHFFHFHFQLFITNENMGS